MDKSALTSNIVVKMIPLHESAPGIHRNTAFSCFADFYKRSCHSYTEPLLSEEWNLASFSYKRNSWTKKNKNHTCGSSDMQTRRVECNNGARGYQSPTMAEEHTSAVSPAPL